MKLVSEFHSVVDAEMASDLLEENGIATFVSSKMSHRMGGFLTGAFRVGLWVILDHQYRDANQLLLNPNHNVQEKLSRSEIIQVRSSVRSGDMSAVLKILFQLLLVVALLALGVVILVRT